MGKGDLVKNILKKSIEAFILGIEIYNKPTIKYRVEGFGFFICNAWELMLKAHIVREFGEKEIYYKDNPNRTITLENCIKKIFTNNKDPLRLNLEKIIELRNVSTHFITEEYEMVYISLFQSCVLNFNEKMKYFHCIDMCDYIPQNFLTLSISMKGLKESEFIAKYPEELANKIFSLKRDIDKLNDETSRNPIFSIDISHYHYITKDKTKADTLVAIDKKADNQVKILKEIKDINNTHPYTMTRALEYINNSLTTIKFNRNHFQLFLKYYNLKMQEKFCYILKNDEQPRYYYSQQAVEFIIAEYVKDPENIIKNIKEKLNKKELTPGAKEF
ncbi:MAG: DUF3644 domain-containing protein [Fusobacterium ulcerans]|uniref:DUF3644 domain-containing protein n=1 Tax=Fusobacterium ulcerans TaxID=861 RepID=UPI003A86C5BC